MILMKHNNTQFLLLFSLDSVCLFVRPSSNPSVFKMFSIFLFLTIFARYLQVNVHTLLQRQILQNNKMPWLCLGQGFFRTPSCRYYNDFSFALCEMSPVLILNALVFAFVFFKYIYVLYMFIHVSYVCPYTYFKYLICRSN